MIRGRNLPPGPRKKSAAWRGGCFMLGFAVLLLVLDWITGSLINVGFGRLTVILIVGGLTLSAPYGIAWLRGELPPPRPEYPVAMPEHVNGKDGATYVIVSPAAPRSGGGVSRAVKAKELGPGAYALYTVFWRWPILIGDAILSGLWSVIGRIWGVSSGPRSTGLGEIDHPENHPPPDRTTF